MAKAKNNDFNKKRVYKICEINRSTAERRGTVRVLMINSVCGIRSTGRICTDLAENMMSRGDTVKIAYGRESVPEKYKEISVCIGSAAGVYLGALQSRLFDNEGFNCKRATKRFLKWADEYDPELLWIHNLHGYYINVELLFEWIKRRPNMKVKWTLHDCWAFTGHCAYFSHVNCDRWKTKCEKCLQTKKYPSSIVDNCRKNFLRKKEAFTGVRNMTLVSPSYWLADLVKQSFLQEYPIEVVYNTINTEVFQPSPSDFKMRYGLEGKKVVLGVASVWEERKGLRDFVHLRALLDNSYVIVLVGVSEKQAANLPDGFLCIPRTDSQRTLAEIYTAANVFVNPSKEETFGLTTLEAISCGTFAIVYKNTACEEVVRHYDNGMALDASPYALADAIKSMI